MKKEVDDLRRFIAAAYNRIYLGELYHDNWGDEFAWEEAKNYFKQVEAETLKINIKELTRDEMDALGFPAWDEELFCVPAYMRTAAIKQGLMTEHDDTDTRCGGLWTKVKPRPTATTGGDGEKESE